MLVFDGDCGFCTSTARWAQRHLPEGTPVEPWQRLDLDEMGLRLSDVSTAAYWRDESGAMHRGHRAAGQVLFAFGGAWRVLGWLCLVPPTSWFAAILYRVIARYRHRMPGGTPACRIDAPH